MEEKMAGRLMSELLKLRAESAFFEKAIESSVDAIIGMSSDGKVSRWNKSATKIFGWSTDEAIGETLHSLIAPVRYREQYERAFPHFRKTGEGKEIGRTVVLEALHKDGHEFPIELSLFTVKTEEGQYGAVGIVRDITERKNAEDRIRKSEEKYRSLFNKMLEGAALHEIICDDSGNPIDYRFIDVNPAFENLTGLQASKIIGKTVLEVLPDTEDVWIKQYGRVALEGSSMVFEEYSKELNRWFRVSAYKAGEGLFACMFSDISERKEAEIQTLRDQENLAGLVSEKTQEIFRMERALVASKKLALLGLLAGTIAHEVGNPLAVIGTSVHLMRKRIPSEDEDLKRYVDDVEKAVRLCADVIDSTRGVARGGTLKMEPVSPQLVVEYALEKCTKPPDVKIVIRPPEKSFMVLGDQVQLYLAVRNIVNNAFQAMSHGGELTISINADDPEFARISIADTGTGIPNEKIGEIFEPLYSTKDDGMGFGISIAKMAIERHRGKITVESKVGEGTCFVIHLPYMAE